MYYTIGRVLTSFTVGYVLFYLFHVLHSYKQSIIAFIHLTKCRGRHQICERNTPNTRPTHIQHKHAAHRRRTTQVALMDIRKPYWCILSLHSCYLQFHNATHRQHKHSTRRIRRIRTKQVSLMDIWQPYWCILFVHSCYLQFHTIQQPTLLGT